MATTFVGEELKAGVHLVSIKGDLDAPGGLAVKGGLESYVAEISAACIIDLSGVEYMSSYGLRVLLTTAQILQREGGQLHLAAPNSRVTDVLVTSGYNSLFPVHNTVNEAKKSLGA